MARAHNVHETTVEVAGAQGFAKDPVQHFFLERYAEAYRRELAAFVAAVRSGARPSPDGRDGLAAQRLADGATERGRPAAPSQSRLHS